MGSARIRVGNILKENPPKPTSGIPADALCIFKDGNAWCCVFGDFQNLQESPAGFGDTSDEAMKNLQVEMERTKP